MTIAGSLDVRAPVWPPVPEDEAARARDGGAPNPRLRLGRRAGWPLLLIAGWLAQAGFRLLIAGGAAVPAAFPDESGYLIAARWLAGGPAADLSGSTFYQAGYPLLITPAFWLSHDPQTCYRIVLAINALAGAAAFPLACTALRRLGLHRAAAYVTGFAAALLPAATVFGPLALTDAILPALVLAWLVALHTFARACRGTPGPAARAVASGAAASLAAAYVYTTHARGAVVLAVHAVVLAGVLAAALAGRLGRRWRAAAPVAAALAVLVVAAAAGHALNGAVRAALYPGGVRDLGGLLSARMSTPSGLAWTVFGAAGQIWYLIAATWGLAGVGLAAEGRTLLRRGADPAARALAGAALAVTAGIALASSAALPDEHRVGNFAYGRYLACVAVAHTLVALAVLLRRRRSAARHAFVAGIALTGCGLSVATYAGPRLTGYHFIAFDFPETSFLTWDWSSLRIGTASVVALALLGLLVAAAYAPRPAWTIAVGLTALHVAAALVICAPGRAHRVPIFRPGPPRGGVAVDAGLTWRVWVRQAYQVWWTPLSRFRSADGGPPAGACMVIVPVRDGAAPAASWPRHPAGWRVTAHGRAPVPWAAWQPVDCHRPVT